MSECEQGLERRQVRTLTVLPENLGSIPAPTWQLRTTCNSRPRGCKTSDLKSTKHTHLTYEHPRKMNKQVKPIEKINVYLKDYYKENKDNRAAER